MSAKQLCSYCGDRPRAEVEPINRDRIWANYCRECQAAFSIVYTSADEGIRFGVNKEKSIVVLEVAQTMEAASHSGGRATMLKSLDRRLRVLRKAQVAA